MIQIESGLFLLFALLLLVFPLDWIGAVIIASLVHELMHILMLYILKSELFMIRILPGGCVIESGFMKPWKQFICILAGPLGSLSLLMLCHSAPRIAICGMLQGIYNLIPVLPLDGGRLLRLVLEGLSPEYADTGMFIGAVISCLTVTGLAIWVNSMVSVQIWMLILALVWNVRFLPRKIPCKQS